MTIKELLNKVKKINIDTIKIIDLQQYKIFEFKQNEIPNNALNQNILNWSINGICEPSKRPTKTILKITINYGN